MAITIIDGFEVNNSGPIDNRIIATTSSDREALVATSSGHPYSFVYDGLRVFQLSDRTTWTWNSGGYTWSADSAGNVLTNTGGASYSSTYIPFWSPVGSGVLGSSPIHITQSGAFSESGAQIKKYLYLGGSQSLPYDIVLGASDDNWFTLASSNNINGIQIRNTTSNTDKINAGGQVTHKLYGDTTKSVTKLFTSSGYAQVNLDTSFLISSDKSILIGSDATASTGGNVTLYAGNSSALTGGNVYLISGNGLSTPGDVIIVSGVDASGIAKAGNIRFLPGFGGGPFTDPKSGFVESTAPFKFDSSIYERTRIISVNNISVSISDLDTNIIVDNTGSSGISINLPDLTGRYDGRKLTIQCATFSNSATLTPFGSQKIYYNGSFVPSIILYKGYSIDILGYGQNWYVVSSTFVNESWKTIGGGGTFQNGQSIPIFGYPTTSSSIQVRKTASGKIAIRGYVNLTNPWASGQTLFTLPIGYRPSGLITLLSELYSSNIILFSNGDITISGMTGATYIGIPEIEVSLD